MNYHHQPKRILDFRKKVNHLFIDKFLLFIKTLDKKYKKGYFYGIFCNPIITLDYIEDNYNKISDDEWGFGVLCNPNITLEFIEKYPERPLKWSSIISQRCIKIEIINRYPEKNWCWELYRNITLKDFENYLEKYPEHFRGNINRKERIINFYKNRSNEEKSYPIITMEIIEEFVERYLKEVYIYNPYETCPYNNPFELDKKKIIIKNYREYLAAYKIQRWYIHIKCNPAYKFCRKKIESFYDENF